MDLGSFASARKLLGYSQAQLAHAAGVSIANLQKLEAGKANPSLKTLQALARVLGRRVEVGLAPVPWDELAALGVPLEQQRPAGVTRSRDQLLRALAIACRAVVDADDESMVRERSALRATLAAIRDHYPLLYKNWVSSRAFMRRLLDEQSLSGAEIKLRRIALATLSTYL